MTIKRIGFMCDCGALTTNRDGICDDCFARAYRDRQFELEMARENFEFERLERQKLWIGGTIFTFGLIVFFFSLYWSLS